MTEMALQPPGSLADTELRTLTEGYQLAVAGRYRACIVGDLARQLGAGPFFVSRKYDGELWYLVATPAGPLLIARNGRVITGGPAVAGDGLPPGTVLAGELHVPRGEAGRERVGDVAQSLSSGGSELAFAAFDVVRTPEWRWHEATVQQRMDALQAMTLAPPCSVVPITMATSPADVAGAYRTLTQGGSAEGIVVRSVDGRVVKVKPDITIDAAIIGFTVRDSESGAHELRSLLIALSVDEAWLPLCSVGNVVDGNDRAALLAEVAPLSCDSHYRRAAANGQTYQMIRPELVAEVRVIDVQDSDARGQVIQQPVLHLTDNTWTVAGSTCSPTALSPVMMRLRHDKPDAREGARWTQLKEYVAETPATLAELPRAAVVIRRVWTKTVKEKTDVRKLVVWQTHKDALDPSHPAYVVHWTDYAAGRKTPLSREVRPAAGRDQAEQVADMMIAENIKRGWIEHT